MISATVVSYSKKRKPIVTALFIQPQSGCAFATQARRHESPRAQSRPYPWSWQPPVNWRLLPPAERASRKSNPNHLRSPAKTMTRGATAPPRKVPRACAYPAELLSVAGWRALKLLFTISNKKQLKAPATAKQ